MQGQVEHPKTWKRDITQIGGFLEDISPLCGASHPVWVNFRSSLDETPNKIEPPA